MLRENMQHMPLSLLNLFKIKAYYRFIRTTVLVNIVIRGLKKLKH